VLLDLIGLVTAVVCGLRCAAERCDAAYVKLQLSFAVD